MPSPRASISTPLPHKKTTLTSLPSEIRVEILKYVLAQDANTGFLFSDSSHPPGLHLSPTYSASAHLSPLLACRQFASDCTTLAFQSTHFPIRDASTPVSTRLSILAPLQTSALRNISLVVAETHLKDVASWARYPFDNPDLHLDVLSIVFLRSESVFSPHDATFAFVALLRRLENVRTLRFIRNGANVKGSFALWYHRLIGLHMKEDHRQRYDLESSPQLPKRWWDWSFSGSEQSFSLTATDPAGVMEESAYLEMRKPRLQEIMHGIVDEETAAYESRVGMGH